MKFHEKIRSFRLWLSRLAARLFPRGIYYVSGPETLPPPLSREEEREALDRLSASPGEVTADNVSSCGLLRGV